MNTPAALVFVSLAPGTPSCSNLTEASPTTVPAELTTLPWTIPELRVLRDCQRHAHEDCDDSGNRPKTPEVRTRQSKGTHHERNLTVLLGNFTRWLVLTPPVASFWPWPGPDKSLICVTLSLAVANPAVESRRRCGPAPGETHVGVENACLRTVFRLAIIYS